MGMGRFLIFFCVFSCALTGMIRQVETLRSIAATKVLSDALLVEKASMAPTDISEFVKEKALLSIKQSLYPLKLTKPHHVPIKHNGVCALVATGDSTHQIISIGCDGTIAFCSDAAPYFCRSINTAHRWYCACLQEQYAILCLGDISGNIGFMSIESKKPERIFRAHAQAVNSLFLSPDQQHLISSSNDSNIGLWHISDNQTRAIFRGHTKAVRDAFPIFSFQKIVSGSSDRTIRLWDIERAQEEHNYFLRETIFQSANIFRLARHPHEQYCVSGLDDGKVVLWDIRQRRFVECLRGHSTIISALICSDDGNYIASGSWGTKIRLWDMRMMACSAVLAYHKDWVQSLTSLRDFNKIVSGSRDGAVKVVDVSSILAIDRMNNLKSIAAKAALISEKKPTCSEDRLNMLEQIMH